MYYASCLIQLYCNEIVAPFKVVELENNQIVYVMKDLRHASAFIALPQVLELDVQSLTFNVAFSKDVK